MVTHSSILAWRIPTVRGAWKTTVHVVAKSWTHLSDKAECVYTHTHKYGLNNIYIVFFGGSISKESTFNAGTQVQSPGLRRSAGEGNGSPLQNSWTILWTEEPGGLYSPWDCKELDTTEVT